MELLLGWIGLKNALKIASYTKDQYPLLVFLSSDNSSITIRRILASDKTIQNDTCMLRILSNVQDSFYSPNNEVNETDKNWCISESHFAPILPQDAQFQKIANNLNIKMEKIIAIEKVENIKWSIQYLEKKKLVGKRITDNEKEKILFYGCPLSMAQDILRSGFDLDKHRIHGKFFKLLSFF